MRSWLQRRIPAVHEVGWWTGGLVAVLLTSVGVLAIQEWSLWGLVPLFYGVTNIVFFLLIQLGIMSRP